MVPTWHATGADVRSNVDRFHNMVRLRSSSLQGKACADSLREAQRIPITVRPLSWQGLRSISYVRLSTVELRLRKSSICRDSGTLAPVSAMPVFGVRQARLTHFDVRPLRIGDLCQ